MNNLIFTSVTHRVIMNLIPPIVVQYLVTSTIDFSLLGFPVSGPPSVAVKSWQRGSRGIVTRKICLVTAGDGVPPHPETKTKEKGVVFSRVYCSWIIVRTQICHVSLSTIENTEGKRTESSRRSEKRDEGQIKRCKKWDGFSIKLHV